ncbi:nucleotidyl transferase AbiEii/AbiGii toxin family protein [Candidatus Ruminimicrobium bovinum]|uniref:nucleotidyl transferase AbiEii/AbiGii toxin family protein n=1 Tax=Candidatus Ruminimicrobium bovinum TaxID=3242779 RepID=UPI0039B8BF80
MIKSDSVKGKIKNISKKSGVSPQQLLQMFMFEQFLVKLSKSKYKNKFILKGGFLLSKIFGESNRTTKDIDTTIKGLPLQKENIKEIINEIINIPYQENITFKLVDIENIRKDDLYSGLRVTINVIFETINENLKIDITTGDIIIPKEIQFEYKLMFEDKTIFIMTYSIETIIAEKFETIISRNILNTRAKDFYDIYMLVQQNNFNKKNLVTVINKTFTKRETSSNIKEIENVIQIGVWL